VSVARRRVLVVQESLPQYRVPLFQRLRSDLAGSGVVLDVAHGRPVGSVAARNDAGLLPWSRRFRNRRVRVGGRHITWQPAYRMSGRYDLVVVEQASRLVLNYLLLARQAAGGPRLALWGHGCGLQGGDSPAARTLVRANRAVCRLPHWWFAYTEGSAARVRAAGYPDERITVVQNATDTSWAAVGTGIAKVPQRCAVVGSLSPDKRLDFLIAAADVVARRRPAFEVVVIGDGPERPRVLAWAADRPYLSYRGPLFGDAKAAELAAATLVLNPGRVGLGALDAFAAGAPLVTTRGSHHSPEVEYLRHARNGWLTADDVDAYAETVDHLLGDGHRLAEMAAGCRRDARRYSLGAMVDRFAEGVLDACAAAGRPAGKAG
jgi:glycosyltransferase involved in cell wall biosynthesis